MHSPNNNTTERTHDYTATQNQVIIAQQEVTQLQHYAKQQSQPRLSTQCAPISCSEKVDPTRSNTVCSRLVFDTSAVAGKSCNIPHSCGIAVG